MGLLRLAGALVGWPFGFALGAELLQISQVSPLSNQVLVMFLLAAMFAILGWLGAPYVTVAPARFVLRRIHAASAGDLVGGAVGGGVGLLLGLLLAFPLALLPEELGQFAPIAGAAFLGGFGAAAGIVKRREILALVREVRAPQAQAGKRRILLDTSVIIDGRVADVARAGFLSEILVVPRFVLNELQHYADSSDVLRRERGRRGLELLARMQKEGGAAIEVSEIDPPATGADAKLIALARSLGAPVLSNDYGLNRVAEIQGVTARNMNDLAKAMRPVVLPGEEMTIRVMQEGKEPGQGVGYLEDGTMIVVEGGVRFMGGDARVTVMRVLQTVAGRMIFAQPQDDPAQARRAG
ncbi:MAG: PIN domain-containing protein [Chloroflexi bacterium]|nr:PIN domain-containing protein [Chloroflexota bacterium]